MSAFRIVLDLHVTDEPAMLVALFDRIQDCSTPGARDAMTRDPARALLGFLADFLADVPGVAIASAACEPLDD